jgi:hypothetical protein
MSKEITPAKRKELGEVELPEELIETYRTVCKKIADFTAIKESLREVIETHLGRNEFGLVNGEPVLRWQHTSSNRLDINLLRENVDPVVLASCYAETSGRRLVMQAVEK